jgi:hypothetical protein
MTELVFHGAHPQRPVRCRGELLDRAVAAAKRKWEEDQLYCDLHRDCENCEPVFRGIIEAAIITALVEDRAVTGESVDKDASPDHRPVVERWDFPRGR